MRLELLNQLYVCKYLPHRRRWRTRNLKRELCKQLAYFHDSALTLVSYRDIRDNRIISRAPIAEADAMVEMREGYDGTDGSDGIQNR
jgi:hypothetical protein